MTKRLAPASLNDAFVQLHQILPAVVIEELRHTSRGMLFLFHLDIVEYIRHNWVQGVGSPLAEKLASVGYISNYVSIAELICEAFWLHLNGQMDESGLRGLLQRNGLLWAHSNVPAEKLTDLLA